MANQKVAKRAGKYNNESDDNYIWLKDRYGHGWQVDWGMEKWRFKAIVGMSGNPMLIMFLFGLNTTNGNIPFGPIMLQLYKRFIVE